MTLRTILHRLRLAFTSSHIHIEPETITVRRADLHQIISCAYANTTGQMMALRDLRAALHHPDEKP